MRINRLRGFRQRDNRNDLFRCKIFIMRVRIMVTVPDKSAHARRKSVLISGFHKTVESFERKGIIAFAPARHDSQQRKVVPVLSDDQMVITVAEDKTVMVMIITLLRRRTGKKAVMITVINAGSPAFARRPTGG